MNITSRSWVLRSVPMSSGMCWALSPDTSLNPLLVLFLYLFSLSFLPVWIGIELFTNVERRGVYEHKWDSRQPLKHAGAIVCAQICCDLKPGHWSSHGSGFLDTPLHETSWQIPLDQEITAILESFPRNRPTPFSSKSCLALFQEPRKWFGNPESSKMQRQVAGSAAIVVSQISSTITALSSLQSSFVPQGRLTGPKEAALCFA